MAAASSSTRAVVSHMRQFSSCRSRLNAVAVDQPVFQRRPDRKRWSRSEIQSIYDSPLLELIFRAASVHRANHDPSKVQLCTLLNIKTGGCSEDCSYCSQSSKNPTGLKATKLMDIEPVLVEARKAKENGSTRFCMGAAWRDLNGRKTNFKRILEMVREINGMGMEVCTTLGMLDADQAKQLKEAGLTAYNHNLDTSREFYPKVITTRSYDERLKTIDNVRQAGIKVCSGGIIGLGESAKDRVGLIWEMSQSVAPFCRRRGQTPSSNSALTNCLLFFFFPPHFSLHRLALQSGGSSLDATDASGSHTPLRQRYLDLWLPICDGRTGSWLPNPHLRILNCATSHHSPRWRWFIACRNRRSRSR